MATEKPLVQSRMNIPQIVKHPPWTKRPDAARATDFMAVLADETMNHLACTGDLDGHARQSLHNIGRSGKKNPMGTKTEHTA